MLPETGTARVPVTAAPSPAFSLGGRLTNTELDRLGPVEWFLMLRSSMMPHTSHIDSISQPSLVTPTILAMPAAVY